MNPIIVVEYDDGSTESREMSSLGAARRISIELKSDKTVLAVTVYDTNDRMCDAWSWVRK